MDIPTAIEILKDFQHHRAYNRRPDLADALDLSIHALQEKLEREKGD